MRFVRPALVILATLVFAGTEARIGDAPPAEAAFPGENGKIAFVKVQGGNHEIYTMNPDGSEQANITNSPATEGRPRWSADGASMVFTSDRGGATRIYVMRADGTNVQQVTSTGGFNPSLSPDGTRVAYQAQGITGLNHRIVVVNVNGSGSVTITPSSVHANFPSWSPNGAQITFGGRSAGNVESLFVMNANGSNLHALGNAGFQSLYPDWSPDGTKIAYYGQGVVSPGIYVFDISAGTNQQLTGTGGNEPAWSPDGTKIAFTSVALGTFRMSVMDASGSNPMGISSGPSDSGSHWARATGQCPGTAAVVSAATDDDTDGDNIPNNIENNITHTDPDCQDTDGDGLLDPWEVEENVEGAGFDLDGDGDAEVQRDEVFGPYNGQCGEELGPRRELLGQNCGLVFRPDPLKKDVYVEIDWQDCFLGDCPETMFLPGVPVDPSHHSPSMVGLTDVVNVFRSAPVDNPDETQGVNLHILVDEAIRHTHNCDQGVAETRATNFGTAQQRRDGDVIAAKEKVFRYAWSGHSSIKDYTAQACPLPEFWEIIASGAGIHPLPEYDISPHGHAIPGGRDIIVSLAVTWICQIYTFDANEQIDTAPPCFRQIITYPLQIPGLFPARVKLANGGSTPVEMPMHMMIGLPASQGVRQIWGRSFMNLLGYSLGVPASQVGNDPNTSGASPPDSYGSWDGILYAPPAPGAAAIPQGAGDGFVAILPDFSLAEEDGDGDGTAEGVDNCPGMANGGQEDLDGDGLGDGCDLDVDGDGLDAPDDATPRDTDNDGTNNEEDAEDDGDGVADGDDNCPLAANAGQENADDDAAGDACDGDDDADGFPDVLEETVGSDPLAADGLPEFLGFEDSCTDGADNDGDGDTDGADPGCTDADGDTAPDLLDNCPLKTINLIDADADGIGDVCERSPADVNCSGGPDAGDALTLLMHLGGLASEACLPIGQGDPAFGDADCNGAVAGNDVVVALRFAARLAAGIPANCRPYGV